MDGRRSKSSLKEKEEKDDQTVSSCEIVPGCEYDDMANPTNMADLMQVDCDGKNDYLAPNKQPLWFREVSEKLSCIDSMNQKLCSIEEKLTATQEAANFASSQAKEAIDKAIVSHKLAMSTQQENDKLKHEIAVLREKLIQQESQSRRNNLLLDGIPESRNKELWSDCEKLVIDIIVHKMGILDGGLMKIERAHRLGQQIPGKTRSVIVRFLSFKDRETVWSKRSQLKLTNIRVSEDFPTEINNDRRILYPIFRKAQTLDTIKSTKLIVNKLYLNNKEFTCKNLNELPSALRPENLSTKQGNGITLFSSRNSFLSNLYSEVEVTIDRNSYASTEQFFQQQKALFFHDDKTASQIMSEKDPYKIMSLGFRVKGFDEALWLREARKILLKANIAKFTQIKAARDALLATGCDIIGEATPNRTFGIGMRLHDPSALDPSKWTGDNFFGKILEEVRTEIQRL